MRSAREVAHGHFVHKEGNGCEMVVRALKSIGQHREHSERCDQDTAFIEARDAEHALKATGTPAPGEGPK